MSNNDMVMVMREHELKILPQPFEDLLSGAKTGEVRDCRDREFRPGDSVRLVEISGIGIEHGPTGRTMCRVVTHIQTGFGLPESLCVLSYGLPVQQHQGEPVGMLRGSRRVCHCCVGMDREEWCSICDSAAGTEVERLRGELDKALEFVERLRDERETLQTQLAEAQALLGKALTELDHIQEECEGDVTAGYIGCLVDDVVDLLSASAEPSAPECKCDMRTKLVGDGCATCNPERAADLMEPSAPVEIDERAENSERYLWLKENVTGGSLGIPGGWIDDETEHWDRIIDTERKP